MNLLVTDLEGKANLSNNYFASHYSLAKNDSSLSNVRYMTESWFPFFFFDVHGEDILQIMQNLNVYRAHEYDNISLTYPEGFSYPGIPAWAPKFWR